MAQAVWLFLPINVCKFISLSPVGFGKFEFNFRITFALIVTFISVIVGLTSSSVQVNFIRLALA